MTRTSILLLALTLPLPLFAQVAITEVMYDVPGSDSGREWIEIQNVGSAPIDLTKYKLLEAGVKHGITPYSGGAVLTPGAFAVLAENGASFMKDNALFAGPLFKSSFSLSNTGELLTIVDASSSIITSATYSAASGAAGDGLALENNTPWVAATPSPGRAFAQSDLPAPKPAPTKLVATENTKPTVAKNLESKQLVTGAMPLADSPSVPFEEAPRTSPYVWWLALGAVLLLGGTATYVVRRQGAAPTFEISSLADEYEIVE